MAKNEKTGRNDLCPCGSGKKYKKCCLSESYQSQEILDFSWRNIRKIEGNVIDKHLVPYMENKLPKELITLAITDFFPEETPEVADKELLFFNFFMPWLLFNWISEYEDELDINIKNFNSKLTISANYMKTNNYKLNCSEKRFIQAMNETYYSYYTVLEVEKGKSLLVKDILLNTTHQIKEQQGTNYLKRGDIVFSRILTLDNQSIFVGMAPFSIPVNLNTIIIDFKEWLIEENEGNLTGFALRNILEMELIDYFFDILNLLVKQPMPTLCNTDGELIQFSKSYFKINLAIEKAVELLLPLTLEKKSKNFLQEA
jgi:hypothetical protein